MSLADLNTGASVRLEILKLCYRHDRTEEEISLRACKLENYVLSSEPLVDSNPAQPEAKKPRADKGKSPA
jgi:hypothetical protein